MYGRGLFGWGPEGNAGQGEVTNNNNMYGRGLFGWGPEGVWQSQIPPLLGYNCMYQIENPRQTLNQLAQEPYVRIPQAPNLHDHPGYRPSPWKESEEPYRHLYEYDQYEQMRNPDRHSYKNNQYESRNAEELRYTNQELFERHEEIRFFGPSSDGEQRGQYLADIRHEPSFDHHRLGHIERRVTSRTANRGRGRDTLYLDDIWAPPDDEEAFDETPQGPSLMKKTIPPRQFFNEDRGRGHYERKRSSYMTPINKPNNRPKKSDKKVSEKKSSNSKLELADRKSNSSSNSNQTEQKTDLNNKKSTDTVTSPSNEGNKVNVIIDDNHSKTDNEKEKDLHASIIVTQPPESVQKSKQEGEDISCDKQDLSFSTFSEEELDKIKLTPIGFKSEKAIDHKQDVPKTDSNSDKQDTVIIKCTQDDVRSENTGDGKQDVAKTENNCETQVATKTESTLEGSLDKNEAVEKQDVPKTETESSAKKIKNTLIDLEPKKGTGHKPEIPKTESIRIKQDKSEAKCIHNTEESSCTQEELMSGNATFSQQDITGKDINKPLILLSKSSIQSKKDHCIQLIRTDYGLAALNDSNIKNKVSSTNSTLKVIDSHGAILCNKETLSESGTLIADKTVVDSANSADEFVSETVDLEGLKVVDEVIEIVDSPEEVQILEDFQNVTEIVDSPKDDNKSHDLLNETQIDEFLEEGKGKTVLYENDITEISSDSDTSDVNITNKKINKLVNDEGNKRPTETKKGDSILENIATSAVLEPELDDIGDKNNSPQLSQKLCMKLRPIEDLTENSEEGTDFISSNNSRITRKLDPNTKKEKLVVILQNIHLNPDKESTNKKSLIYKNKLQNQILSSSSDKLTKEKDIIDEQEKSDYQLQSTNPLKKDIIVASPAQEKENKPENMQDSIPFLGDGEVKNAERGLTPSPLSFLSEINTKSSYLTPIYEVAQNVSRQKDIYSSSESIADSSQNFDKKNSSLNTDAINPLAGTVINTQATFMNINEPQNLGVVFDNHTVTDMDWHLTTSSPKFSSDEETDQKKNDVDYEQSNEDLFKEMEKLFDPCSNKTLTSIEIATNGNQNMQLPEIVDNSLVERAKSLIWPACINHNLSQIPEVKAKTLIKNMQRQDKSLPNISEVCANISVNDLMEQCKLIDLENLVDKAKKLRKRSEQLLKRRKMNYRSRSLSVDRYEIQKKGLKKSKSFNDINSVIKPDISSLKKYNENSKLNSIQNEVNKQNAVSFGESENKSIKSNLKSAVSSHEPSSSSTKKSEYCPKPKKDGSYEKKHSNKYYESSKKVNYKGEVASIKKSEESQKFKQSTLIKTKSSAKSEETVNVSKKKEPLSEGYKSKHQSESKTYKKNYVKSEEKIILKSNESSHVKKSASTAPRQQNKPTNDKSDKSYIDISKNRSSDQAKYSESKDMTKKIDSGMTWKQTKPSKKDDSNCSNSNETTHLKTLEDKFGKAMSESVKTQSKQNKYQKDENKASNNSRSTGSGQTKKIKFEDATKKSGNAEMQTIPSKLHQSHKSKDVKEKSKYTAPRPESKTSKDKQKKSDSKNYKIDNVAVKISDVKKKSEFKAKPLQQSRTSKEQKQKHNFENLKTYPSNHVKNSETIDIKFRSTEAQQDSKDEKTKDDLDLTKKSESQDAADNSKSTELRQSKIEKSKDDESDYKAELLELLASPEPKMCVEQLEIDSDKTRNTTNTKAAIEDSFEDDFSVRKSKKCMKIESSSDEEEALENKEKNKKQHQNLDSKEEPKKVIESKKDKPASKPQDHHIITSKLNENIVQRDKYQKNKRNSETRSTDVNKTSLKDSQNDLVEKKNKYLKLDSSSEDDPKVDKTYKVKDNETSSKTKTVSKTLAKPSSKTAETSILDSILSEMDKNRSRPNPLSSEAGTSRTDPERNDEKLRGKRQDPRIETSERPDPNHQPSVIPTTTIEPYLTRDPRPLQNKYPEHPFVKYKLVNLESYSREIYLQSTTDRSPNDNSAEINQNSQNSADIGSPEYIQNRRFSEDSTSRQAFGRQTKKNPPRRISLETYSNARRASIESLSSSRRLSVENSSDTFTRSPNDDFVQPQPSRSHRSSLDTSGDSDEEEPITKKEYLDRRRNFIERPHRPSLDTLTSSDSDEQEPITKKQYLDSRRENKPKQVKLSHDPLSNKKSFIRKSNARNVQETYKNLFGSDPEDVHSESFLHNDLRSEQLPNNSVNKQCNESPQNTITKQSTTNIEEHKILIGDQDSSKNSDKSKSSFTSIEKDYLNVEVGETNITNRSTSNPPIKLTLKKVPNEASCSSSERRLSSNSSEQSNNDKASFELIGNEALGNNQEWNKNKEKSNSLSVNTENSSGQLEVVVKKDIDKEIPKPPIKLTLKKVTDVTSINSNIESRISTTNIKTNEQDNLVQDMTTSSNAERRSSTSNRETTLKKSDDSSIIKSSSVHTDSFNEEPIKLILKKVNKDKESKKKSKRCVSTNEKPIPVLKLRRVEDKEKRKRPHGEQTNKKVKRTRLSKPVDEKGSSNSGEPSNPNVSPKIQRIKTLKAQHLVDIENIILITAALNSPLPDYENAQQKIVTDNPYIQADKVCVKNPPEFLKAVSTHTDSDNDIILISPEHPTIDLTVDSDRLLELTETLNGFENGSQESHDESKPLFEAELACLYAANDSKYVDFQAMSAVIPGNLIFRAHDTIENIPKEELTLDEVVTDTSVSGPIQTSAMPSTSAAVPVVKTRIVQEPNKELPITLDSSDFKENSEHILHSKEPMKEVERLIPLVSMEVDIIEPKPEVNETSSESLTNKKQIEQSQIEVLTKSSVQAQPQPSIAESLQLHKEATILTVENSKNLLQNDQESTKSLENQVEEVMSNLMRLNSATNDRRLSNASISSDGEETLQSPKSRAGNLLQNDKNIDNISSLNLTNPVATESPSEYHLNKKQPVSQKVVQTLPEQSTSGGLDSSAAEIHSFKSNSTSKQMKSSNLNADVSDHTKEIPSQSLPPKMIRLRSVASINASVENSVNQVVRLSPQPQNTMRNIPENCHPVVPHVNHQINNQQFNLATQSKDPLVTPQQNLLLPQTSSANAQQRSPFVQSHVTFQIPQNQTLPAIPYHNVVVAPPTNQTSHVLQQNLVSPLTNQNLQLYTMQPLNQIPSEVSQQNVPPPENQSLEIREMQRSNQIPLQAQMQWSNQLPLQAPNQLPPQQNMVPISPNPQYFYQPPISNDLLMETNLTKTDINMLLEMFSSRIYFFYVLREEICKYIKTLQTQKYLIDWFNKEIQYSEERIKNKVLKLAKDLYDKILKLNLKETTTDVNRMVQLVKIFNESIHSQLKTIFNLQLNGTPAIYLFILLDPHRNEFKNMPFLYWLHQLGLHNWRTLQNNLTRAADLESHRFTNTSLGQPYPWYDSTENLPGPSSRPTVAEQQLTRQNVGSQLQHPITNCQDCQAHYGGRSYQQYLQSSVTPVTRQSQNLQNLNRMVSMVGPPNVSIGPSQVRSANSAVILQPTNNLVTLNQPAIEQNTNYFPNQVVMTQSSDYRQMTPSYQNPIGGTASRVQLNMVPLNNIPRGIPSNAPVANQAFMGQSIPKVVMTQSSDYRQMAPSYQNPIGGTASRVQMNIPQGIPSNPRVANQVFMGQSIPNPQVNQPTVVQMGPSMQLAIGPTTSHSQISPVSSFTTQNHPHQMRPPNQSQVLRAVRSNKSRTTFTAPSALTRRMKVPASQKRIDTPRYQPNIDNIPNKKFIYASLPKPNIENLGNTPRYQSNHEVPSSQNNVYLQNFKNVPNNPPPSYQDTVAAKIQRQSEELLIEMLNSSDDASSLFNKPAEEKSPSNIGIKLPFTAPLSTTINTPVITTTLSTSTATNVSSVTQSQNRPATSPLTSRVGEVSAQGKKAKSQSIQRMQQPLNSNPEVNPLKDKVLQPTTVTLPFTSLTVSTSEQLVTSGCTINEQSIKATLIQTTVSTQSSIYTMTKTQPTTISFSPNIVPISITSPPQTTVSTQSSIHTMTETQPTTISFSPPPICRSPSVAKAVTSRTSPRPILPKPITNSSPKQELPVNKRPQKRPRNKEPQGDFSNKVKKFILDGDVIDLESSSDSDSETPEIIKDTFIQLNNTETVQNVTEKATETVLSTSNNNKSLKDQETKEDSTLQLETTINMTDLLPDHPSEGQATHGFIAQNANDNIDDDHEDERLIINDTDEDSYFVEEPRSTTRSEPGDGSRFFKHQGSELLHQMGSDAIDLTLIDDFDMEQVQKDLGLVFVKKEEPITEEEPGSNRLDDFVENSVENPVIVTSPADSGIASPPVQENAEAVSVEDEKLCLCGKKAQYNCVCELTWYCNADCQLEDWESHKNRCSYVPKEEDDSDDNDE